MNYTRRAERQIDELTEHYESKGRAAALIRMRAAILEAEARIVRAPEAGLPAPRPNPTHTEPRTALIKCGRYWFRYTLTTPFTIMAIVFETANIPAHL